MLLDAINRIEINDSIENIALKYHSSRDKKKLITSNNYLTFFCKKVNNLTLDIIDSYYDKLETPKDFLVYRDWIKENIFKISNITNSQEAIKIFFESDIENYIKLGKQYIDNNILSNVTEIDENLYGSSIFSNLNTKKPFLKTLTRKTNIPDLIDTEQAIKYKYLRDILFSFAKKGYDILYILEDGKLTPVSSRFGEPPNKSFVNGIILVYKIDNRGNLVILDMDTIPKFSQYICNTIT